MINKYTVYAKLDGMNSIIEVNSSAFLTDVTNWTAIDEGEGDRYHHAQGNYFDGPLYDSQSCANYKLVSGAPQLRTAQEKAAEIATRPEPDPAPMERVEAQVAYTAMMTDTLLGLEA